MRDWTVLATLPALALACSDTLPGRTPVRVEGAHHHFVVDSIRVPSNVEEARAYGLDLDGDGMFDNDAALGLFALFNGQGCASGIGIIQLCVRFGIDAGATTSRAIDEGAFITLVDLQTSDLADSETTDASAFTLYQGTDPSPIPCDGAGDTSCRRHLAGDGMFEIAPTSPIDPPLLGTVAGHDFSGGPGVLTIQLALGSTIIDLPLLAARTEVSGISETGIASGVIAGGLTQDVVDSQLAPALAGAFASTIERYCCGLATSPGGATCNPLSSGANPNCGCQFSRLVPFIDAGSILRSFDTSPTDCVVTADEIKQNAFFRSATSPDIEIDGTNVLSLGVGFTAVAGSFATP